MAGFFTGQADVFIIFDVCVLRGSVVYLFIRSFIHTLKSFSVTVKNDIAVVVCYTGWADVQWWCTLSTHGIGNASHLRWFYRV